MRRKIISVILLLEVLLIMAMSSCKKPAEENYQKKNENDPVVTIEMENGGIIKIELYPDVAPNTVNNFIYIINQGYLDGTIFHRVGPNFMIQGGQMVNGELDYTIKGDFAENGVTNDLKHERGVISMARTDVNDSATTQFFIMVADNTGLDGLYAAFGKVLTGMDVVDEIVNQEWSISYGGGTGKPKKDQVMKKVTVDTVGIEYPEPEKIQ